MSIESNNSGETPEVAPGKDDPGTVDAVVTAVADEAAAASSVDQPGDEVKSTEAEVTEAEVAASEPADETPASPPADDAVKPKPRRRSRAKAKQDEDPDMDVEPLELIEDESAGEAAEKQWYILKVQVNREGTIRDALERRVKLEGLEPFVDEIVVPTEDIAEFTKSGKRKITKRKLYPGYIMVNMVINDDTWFAVRETPGIGDFTGSAGKPTPMDPREVERILRRDVDEDEETQVKTSIPFNIGDHVRVKEGNFQNFEGDVDKIDEAHGLITVVINIFNRQTPVEIQYWQIEKV